MSNIAIAYENSADTADLTASTAVALAPITLVQNPHVGRKWRSTSNTANFIADFSLASIDTVAIMGITGTTCRVRWNTSDPTGVAGDLYDSAVQSVDQNYKQFIALLNVPASGRFLRVDITNPTGSYVEAGRLFAGLRNQFSQNFVYGWQRQWVDLSTRLRMKSGGFQVFTEDRYVSLELTCQFFTEAERVGFVDAIDRINAMNTDVLLIPNPASSFSVLPREVVWGLIADLTPVTHQMLEYYEKQYRIEQRL